MTKGRLKHVPFLLSSTQIKKPVKQSTPASLKENSTLNPLSVIELLSKDK